MNSARCEKACEYRCRFDDTVGAIWLIMASEENDDTDGSSTEPPSRMRTPIRAAKAHVCTNRLRVRPWLRLQSTVFLILRRLANLDSAERCRAVWVANTCDCCLRNIPLSRDAPPPHSIFATQIFCHASKTLVQMKTIKSVHLVHCVR